MGGGAATASSFLPPCRVGVLAIISLTLMGASSNWSGPASPPQGGARLDSGGKGQRAFKLGEQNQCEASQ